ncbi:ATP-dependent helicase [Candidatus Azambacteria bacterium]|nr:ATP-dependent helicase [Candidatus Azambacteria bacterium]
MDVVFEASNNVLESRAVGIFLDYLSIIDDPYDDRKFLNVLSCGFSGIDTLDAYKLSRYLYEINYSRKEKISAFDAAESLDAPNKESLMIFIKKLSELKKVSAEIAFAPFCEKVLKESGFLEWIYQKDDKMEYLRQISSLFSEIKELNFEDPSLDIKKFLGKIEIYREYKILIQEESFLLEKKGVKVMTAHRSKGLEFEHVFITKAVDNNWGNRKSMDKIKLPENLLDISSKLEFEKNEDERRLFFVALTRAKEKAFITYAEEYRSGGNMQEKTISQFVKEIDEKYVEFSDGDEKVGDVEEFLDEKLRYKEEKKISEDEYLKSLLSDYKLSVTHLDNYLECPRKFKFRNLIRIPEAKTKYMALGTAYHKALERFFLEFKNSGKLPAKDILILEYQNALKRELLTYKEWEELEKMGTEGLSGYYDTYRETMAIPEAVEYDFSRHDVYLENAHLTGKIDKIEKVDEFGNVKVVDYKTGNIRSKNEISGNTKNSDGNLKRQIVFYKILCDLDSRFKGKMVAGELDFVQGKDGKYKKELVEFTDSDVSELKETIISVYNKIINLEFECVDEKGFCDACKEYTKI